MSIINRVLLACVLSMSLFIVATPSITLAEHLSEGSYYSQPWSGQPSTPDPFAETRQREQQEYRNQNPTGTYSQPYSQPRHSEPPSSFNAPLDLYNSFQNGQYSGSCSRAYHSVNCLK